MVDNKEPQFKVGDPVIWMDSPFKIESIQGEKALLKQEFSIRVTLNGLVPLDELKFNYNTN